jgi:diketogulonate reductase-like aldo/keto reductase
MQLEELLESSPRIRPVVNQIEVHHFNRRQNVVTFCAENHTTIQAYSPLVRAQRMSNPILQALAQKLYCTPAQILVRWSLQQGFIALPKSITRERLSKMLELIAFILVTIYEVDGKS